LASGGLQANCSDIGRNVLSAELALPPDTSVFLYERNGMTQLPAGLFRFFPASVTSLQFNDNRITDIAVDAFQNVPQLEKLFFESNSLTALPAGVFTGLGNLTVLLLNLNLFTQLPDLRALSKLRELYLAGNPLKTISFAELGDISRHIGILDLNDALAMVPIIPLDLLYNFTALRGIGLNNNNIFDLPDMFFHSSAITLKFLSLEVLCALYWRDIYKCALLTSLIVLGRTIV
jgi:Leucine-rich repeat (LRR) protein